MPGTVNQYQQTAFVDPQNGQSGDASVVLSNDNATRGKHNSHDADATIHIQSSDLGTRPAAGTPQRAWWTTDEFRLYFDFGGVWNELQVRAEDVIAGTFSGNVTFGGDVAITGALTANGNVTLGNATTDTVTFTGRVASNIIPAADDTYDIGTSLGPLQFRSLYLSGGVFADTGQFTGYVGVNIVTPTVGVDFEVGGVAQFTTTMAAFGDTGLYLQVNGIGLELVSVGALDSGGAGFRVLRIPNL